MPLNMLRCIQRQDSRDIGMYCPRRKLVVVGDGECGKTCLLHRYTRDEFDQDGYLPTMFEVQVASVEHQNTQVELLMYGTKGKGDYDRLRPLCYPDTDAALICFSVDNPDSLENVTYSWAPEVRHFCGNVPVVLVGLKSDLRDGKSKYDLSKLTSVRQGEEMACRVGAVAYMECSAKLDTGVADIFRTAVAEAMKRRKTGKKKGSRR